MITSEVGQQTKSVLSDLLLWQLWTMGVEIFSLEAVWEPVAQEQSQQQTEEWVPRKNLPGADIKQSGKRSWESEFYKHDNDPKLNPPGTTFKKHELKLLGTILTFAQPEHLNLCVGLNLAAWARRTKNIPEPGVKWRVGEHSHSKNRKTLSCCFITRVQAMISATGEFTEDRLSGAQATINITFFVLFSKKRMKH